MGAAFSEIHLSCAFPQKSYSYDSPYGKGLLSYVGAVCHPGNVFTRPVEPINKKLISVEILTMRGGGSLGVFRREGEKSQPSSIVSHIDKL